MNIVEAEIEKQFTGMQQARQPITKRRQLSISHAEGYAANQKAGQQQANAGRFKRKDILASISYTGYITEIKRFTTNYLLTR